MNGIVAALEGYLAADADERFTRTGQRFLSFLLAVRNDKAKDGEDKPATEWVRVTVWDAPDDLGARLVKGTHTYVEGRLRLNEWEGADGARRSGLQLSAWKCEPLYQIGKRKPTEARKQAATHAAARLAEDLDSVPF